MSKTLIEFLINHFPTYLACGLMLERYPTPDDEEVKE